MTEVFNDIIYFLVLFVFFKFYPTVTVNDLVTLGLPIAHLLSAPLLTDLVRSRQKNPDLLNLEFTVGLRDSA